MSDKAAQTELDATIRTFGEAWARGDSARLGEMLSPTYSRGDAHAADSVGLLMHRRTAGKIPNMLRSLGQRAVRSEWRIQMLTAAALLQQTALGEGLATA